MSIFRILHPGSSVGIKDWVLHEIYGAKCFTQNVREKKGGWHLAGSTSTGISQPAENEGGNACASAAMAAAATTAAARLDAAKSSAASSWGSGLSNPCAPANAHAQHSILMDDRKAPL
jgi:mannose/cellobiose epimerase-like protein (N-acyl-D-glucosamine 2-epimerase family)